jgi:heme-degrading monooxygenase HmoA
MEEETMILATGRIEDLDRFLNAFKNEGGPLRKQHGSRGAEVFRDPSDANRMWVVFDWDDEGWESYVSDPAAAEVFKDAGLEAPPVEAEKVADHES